MKELDNKHTESIAEAKSSFNGFTLEELRYQRAMMALKREYCRAKMTKSLENLNSSPKKMKHGGSLSNNKALSIAGTVASKVFSHLNVVDYVLMGLSFAGTIRKGIRLFKGKK